MTDPRERLDPSRFQQRASIARFDGDGARKDFFLPKKPRRGEDIDVYQQGIWMEPDEKGTPRGYKWDGDRKITMNVAPAVGQRLILKVQGA